MIKTMKINNKIIAVAFSTALVACNNAAPETTVDAIEAQEVKTETIESSTYTVSTEGDEISWEGYKTFAVGDSHNGTMQVSEGEFMVEGGQLVGGSFLIDMNSINSVDLADDADSKGKLEGHLKSPDFFAVDSFPSAKFVITAAEAVAASDTTGATHNVSGNLTLRGITKNISVPAMVEMTDAGINFSTLEFVIDRSQWNVQFRSTAFTKFADLAKDKIIDNNIKLSIKLMAPKA
jgi:polyisoprenoid-binding protein YceI